MTKKCCRHIVCSTSFLSVFNSKFSFLTKIAKSRLNRHSTRYSLFTIHYSLACAQRAQALTPSVVPSAVSTVTMICITVFQNSLFFIRFYFFVNNNYF